MERAVHEGEVVTAKTRARLLSTIPQASTGNRILLLDLHSEGMPYYFEDTCRPVHLTARPLFAEAARTSDDLRQLGLNNQRLAINGVFHASDRSDAVPESLRPR